MIPLVFDPFGPEEERFKEFLDRHVDSFIAWDLLIFFYGNPNTIETADGLAKRLGRLPADVAHSLNVLAAKGILQMKQKAGQDIYVYAPSNELQQQIGAFVDALQSREKRLAALTHVLQKEAFYNTVNK